MRSTLAAILAWLLAGASAAALWISWSGLRDARGERADLRAKIDGGIRNLDFQADPGPDGFRIRVPAKALFQAMSAVHSPQ